jgi:hypothetical protein
MLGLCTEFWVMTPCVVEMFPCQSPLGEQRNFYVVMCQNIIIRIYLSQESSSGVLWTQ